MVRIINQCLAKSKGGLRKTWKMKMYAIKSVLILLENFGPSEKEGVNFMQDYYENVEWIINEATQKELKNTCMDFYRELCRWTNMEWSMDTIKPLKKEA